ncbi:MAG: LysR family transcriptional regulator [Bacteriovoracaceae bacterium]|jgi:DNA-binding transcriptional LysR family regulator|nr:LysR family transcriptional regulator [Bacteriovoracaceae bacterium]
MFDQIEALWAISRYQTMGKAGTYLRVSQSAISKRLAGLESQIGKKLVHKKGRYVVLTTEGENLLKQVSPLLTQLRSVLFESETKGYQHNLVMGVSESIFSSWGAKSLFLARKKSPKLNFEIHTHRTPVILDKINSGEYHIGLCSGLAEDAPQLEVQTIAYEPMVIIPKGLVETNLSRIRKEEVYTIEIHSETWRTIFRKLPKAKINITGGMESFFAVAASAISGFAHGLVPLGVAKAYKIPEKKIIYLKKYELQRPISIVGNKSVIHGGEIAKFTTILEKQLSL